MILYYVFTVFLTLRMLSTGMSNRKDISSGDVLFKYIDRKIQKPARNEKMCFLVENGIYNMLERNKEIMKIPDGFDS